MRLMGIALLLFSTAVLGAPLKLAAPGLTVSEVDPGKARFFNDFLATELARTGDVQITTESEIQTVLGLERQKQLLGCTDESACLAEIASALGVDGIIVGSLVRFDSKYAMTVRIVSSRAASVWASASTRGKDANQLLEWIAQTAPELVRQLPGVTRREELQERTMVFRLSAPIVAAEVDTKVGTSVWLGLRIGLELGAHLYARSRFALTRVISAGGELLLRLRPPPGESGLGYLAGIGAGIEGDQFDSPPWLGLRAGAGAEWIMGHWVFGLELRYSYVMGGPGTGPQSRLALFPSIQYEF